MSTRGPIILMAMGVGLGVGACGVPVTAEPTATPAATATGNTGEPTATADAEDDAACTELLAGAIDSFRTGETTLADALELVTEDAQSDFADLLLAIDTDAPTAEAVTVLDGTHHSGWCAVPEDPAPPTATPTPAETSPAPAAPSPAPTAATAADAPAETTPGTAAPTRTPAPPPEPPPAPAPAPPAPPAPASAPRPVVEDTFDEDYAATVVGWVLEDIATADERFHDRPDIMGFAPLMNLADDMRRLAHAGVPPGTDPVEYLARLATLEEFFDRAAEEITEDIPTAAGTYTVARQHTQEVLDALNPVLGTAHTLPPWSWL